MEMDPWEMDNSPLTQTFTVNNSYIIKDTRGFPVKYFKINNPDNNNPVNRDALDQYIVKLTQLVPVTLGDETTFIENILHRPFTVEYRQIKLCISEGKCVVLPESIGGKKSRKNRKHKTKLKKRRRRTTRKRSY
jgi:hypothetical protein